MTNFVILGLKGLKPHPLHFPSISVWLLHLVVRVTACQEGEGEGDMEAEVAGGREEEEAREGGKASLAAINFWDPVPEDIATSTAVHTSTFTTQWHEQPLV